VLLDRLDDRVDELPEADRDPGKQLLDGLRSRRDAARAELLAGLRSERYVALLDELVPATHDTSLAPEPDDVEIVSLVRKPWGKLRDAVDALPDEPADAELHRVRILSKRARYGAEAVSPALGKPARRFARRAADLQDVLGEHQDAVVAQHWLREHAEGTADRAFVAGELAAIEHGAALDARECWRPAWKRLRRVRPSTW
jgi:CHAD domain-containing protein